MAVSLINGLVGEQEQAYQVQRGGDSDGLKGVKFRSYLHNIIVVIKQYSRQQNEDRRYG